MRVSKDSILAFLLAGGVGKRLYPLTAERTKPSVPFGGKYRIIDFALSNLANSEIYSIYVLVQYKSQSLIEHIRTTWIKEGVLPRHFITVVPPQMRREGVSGWYRGTADSVYQNINLVYDFKPKFVAIFSGDHIYRMNIKQMLDFHIKNKAHLTISAIPIESEQAVHFGIVDVDKNARIEKFREKPLLTGKKPVLASMGNYIFNADVLVETLEAEIEKTTSHDFGKDIIPYLVEKKMRVFAYDFAKNTVPSLKKFEEGGYWRDVGTIESYWSANMDLLGKNPKLDLDNQSWPIYASSLNYPPGYIIDSVVDNSLIGEGAKVCGAKIKNSILGRAVKVSEGCKIEDSIIMDFTTVGKNCKIKKSIIDRVNNIPRNTRIGYNSDKDCKKYFVDPCGITVVRRGARKIFY